MPLYAADGSMNVTVVSGASYTGLYAPDGSINVIKAPGGTYVGAYHPCGAWWVNVAGSPSVGANPLRNVDGSLNVSEPPYTNGGMKVTVVSGSLGGTVPSTPVLTWTSGTNDLTPDGTVTFDNTVIAGNTLTSQIQVAGGDWSSPVVNNNHVITAGEDLVNEVDLANADLSPGSYDWRVRITNGAGPSNWSNVETKTLVGFEPSSLTGIVSWFAVNKGGLFQLRAGTTAASANNDPVAYIPDQVGGGATFKSPDDTTSRPLLGGVSVNPYVLLDGVNDYYLRSAILNSYASGTGYTWVMAYRSNSAALGAALAAEANSGNGNTAMIPHRVDGTTQTSSAMFYRNDAGTSAGTATPAGSTPLNTLTMDGNDHVMIVTDDLTTISVYVNGVTRTGITGITRNGSALTVDRMAIGCYPRSSIGGFWAGRVYGGAFLNRVVDSTERANLTTWAGALAGLSL
jgi:hypothetical protein